VGYDALVESVRLIESGFETDPVRLSRRRRFAPVAFDVQGDLAATWFVRRGTGTFWHEIHTLKCTNGSWARLGGGGYSSDEDGLADRAPAAELPGPLQVSPGGATALGTGSWSPAPDRFLRYALLCAAQEVVALDLGQRAPLPVPRHGRLMVIWTERAPVVRALGPQDEEISSARV
jgi:hypothetical protein